MHIHPFIQNVLLHILLDLLVINTVEVKMRPYTCALGDLRGGGPVILMERDLLLALGQDGLAFWLPGYIYPAFFR